MDKKLLIIILKVVIILSIIILVWDLLYGYEISNYSEIKIIVGFI